MKQTCTICSKEPSTCGQDPDECAVIAGMLYLDEIVLRIYPEETMSQRKEIP